MLKETFTMSNKGNLEIVKCFINATENKNYIIDKIVREVVAENDPFGGYDTGQRTMTIYYKVNKDKKEVTNEL